MHYVAYGVCASIRDAFYTGTGESHAPFGHTPTPYLNCNFAHLSALDRREEAHETTASGLNCDWQDELPIL